MKTFLDLAGEKAVLSHNSWLTALSEDAAEPLKSLAKKQGDELWDEAVKSLRFHGLGELPHDDLDQAEDSLNRELLDTAPLDFKPLRHAIFLHTAIKIFNRVALAALIFAAGYLYSFSTSHDVKSVTETDVQQLQQLDNQLQKKEKNHE